VKCIRYACGYKYQLRETYRTRVEILPDRPIVTPWIWLAVDGLLTISAGYAWDGPSGPALDTPDGMRGSLVHDALYQLIREGHLPQSEREYADNALRRIVREDGMWRWRVWYWNIAVRLCGAPAADPANQKPDKCAPKGCPCAQATQ
jgi:hypothetical protein